MEDPPSRTEDVAGRTDTYRSRTVEWLLLTGNRGLVALGITAVLAGFFAGLVGLGWVPLAETQAVFYAYSALIAGNLTLVTVVVTINQLFLSRELRSPGELQTRIDNIAEYRAGIEAATGEIAPSMPLEFLRVLVEATRQQAQCVGGIARDGVVTSGGEEVREVVEILTDQMDRIERHLVGSDPDTFAVLSVMLGTNYAHQIYRLRAARAGHAQDFEPVAHEAVEDLVDRLEDVDVSRQYFRSIYLQEELSAVSRLLLYTGLPSVAVALGTLLVLTGPPDAGLAARGIRPLIPATLTVGLVPLTVLCSFFLRPATVTKLTAATVPFTTPADARL